MQAMTEPLTDAPELSVMGSTCRTIISGQQTDGRLAIVHIEASAGIGVPTHVHDKQDEVFHVLSGSICMNVGGREVLVRAGESAFGPRGVPHSWYADEPSSFVVSVTPSGLEEMFVELDALGEQQRDMPRALDICKRYDIRFI